MRTPKARIKGNLRMMFVRSSERSEALKRASYSCEKCGIKQSKKKGCEVKIEVHHKEGINVWNEVISLIQEKILCDSSKLQVLCRDCHAEETAKQ
jgi:hypothetical protein